VHPAPGSATRPGHAAEAARADAAGPVYLTLGRVTQALPLATPHEPGRCREVVMVKARRMRVDEPLDPRSVGWGELLGAGLLVQIR
jgi:hypothetical protein